MNNMNIVYSVQDSGVTYIWCWAVTAIVSHSKSFSITPSSVLMQSAEFLLHLNLLLSLVKMGRSGFDMILGGKTSVRSTGFLIV